ncbi:MAG: tetratricopeptide repeat protein [Myxococcales bacterium]
MNIGFMLHERFEEAYRFIALARAELRRLGNRPLLEARLSSAEGIVFSSERRFEEAARSHRRALELLERSKPDALDVALELNRLALAQLSLEDYAGALASLERAEQINRRELGEHERVYMTRNNIGMVLRWLGREDEALEAYREAAEGTERLLGAEHPSYAKVIHNAAVSWREKGRCDLARAQFERVLAIRERAFGSDSPLVAYVLEELARCDVQEGRARDAISRVERAQRIGASKPLSPLRDGQLLTSLGEALILLGERQRGVLELERALARIGEGGDVYTREARGTTSWALARAIARQDAARATALAREARGLYESVGPRYRREVAEIDAWLASSR